MELPSAPFFPDANIVAHPDHLAMGVEQAILQHVIFAFGQGLVAGGKGARTVLRMDAVLPKIGFHQPALGGVAQQSL